MKFKLIIMILLLKVLNTNAQCTDCEVKQIDTDPRTATNCEKPATANQFYWFPNNGNNNSLLNAYYSYAGGNITSTLNNPYWTFGSGPIVGSMAGQQYSDFHPEDGWEVIKIDNGYLADNTTKRNTARTMVYMCFYNKYRGIMRFFGMLPSGPPWQIIRFKITIPQYKRTHNSPNYNYKGQELQASNTLSIQGNSTQPLDQETDDKSLEVVTQFPGGSPSEHFFWFEVPMAYDPCICKNDVAIYLTSTIEQNFDLTIKGALDGKIIQKTEMDVNLQQQNYNKLVLNRIIGAATATAIATKGTVIQVSKYTELIDILSKKPGVNANDQAKLESLKKVLNLATEFVYDEKNQKWKNINSGEEVTKDDWEKILTSVNTYLSGTFDMFNPGGGGNKSSTSVVASLTATGTANTFLPQGTSIFWGMPGSKMNKDLAEQEVAIDDNNNQVADYINPEYPLYNQAMGTFALLRTPTVYHKLDIVEICDEPNLINGGSMKSNNPKYTIQLKDDFLYYINPDLKINLSKTIIKSAFVLKAGNSKLYNLSKIRQTLPENNLTDCGDNLSGLIDKISNVNFSRTLLGDEYISPLVPINQFRDLISTFTFDKDFIVDIKLPEKLFIRFFIEFESNDLGKDGKPIKSTQVFTFPVKLENKFDAFSEIINVNPDGNEKDYNTDVVFNNNKSLFFKGLVKITAKLSTTNGIKKKIYSTVGFEIEQGGEVSPDIELIIGFPLLGTYPQPMQTSAYVESFCNSQIKDLQYKANSFTQSAIKREKEEYEEQARVIKENEEKQKSKITYKLSPNPTTTNFTVSIFNNNEQDYNIALMDVTGKVLLNNLYNGKQTSQFIETNGLAAGIYFVKITCGNTQKTVKLIIHNNQ
jgi:hypothetical protein